MSLPSPRESTSSPNPEPALAAARSVLGELSELYRARYGHAIFDLQAVPDEGGGWRLEGCVLLRAQLDEAVKRLGSVFGGEPRVSVAVMSEPAVATRWAAVRARVADVFRAPEGEHASELSTQALAEHPPLRVLDERGDRSLVQLWDLTLGWVASEGLVPLGELPDHPWREVKLSTENSVPSNL